MILDKNGRIDIRYISIIKAAYSRAYDYIVLSEIDGIRFAVDRGIVKDKDVQ